MSVARLGGWEDDWFAVVATPVRVHYAEWAPMPWRCELCGRHKKPTCEHEHAAATAAAQQFQPKEK